MAECVMIYTGETEKTIDGIRLIPVKKALMTLD
jgi:hypothetical protein